EVGRDPAGAARHGETHVTVTAVYVEVVVPRGPQDGRPVRGHGPVARAIRAAVVVRGLRQQAVGGLPDDAEVAIAIRGFLPGEFCARRHAQLVAHAAPGHQQLLIYGAHPRYRTARVLDRKSCAVTLGGRDWQPDPDRPRDLRAVDPGAEHEHVAADGIAGLGRQRLDSAALRDQLLDAGAKHEPGAHPLTDRPQGARELHAVAARIRRAVDRPGKLVTDGRQGGLDLRHVVGAQDLLR